MGVYHDIVRMIWPFLAGRIIWEFRYRRSKMEKIYRRIRTVYTIANTDCDDNHGPER
jgi:hypothetical protein